MNQREDSRRLPERMTVRSVLLPLSEATVQKLEAMGYRREDVFICNVLKCRPPGNRNPSLEEAAACAGFLRRQIALESKDA